MSDVDAVRALARLSRVIERACPDLSLAHYRVLSAVADGDERATLLARRLALGKPTISASVEALCRRGLLERREVAGDQRATALVLTSEGRQVLAHTEEAMTGRLAVVLAQTEDPDGARLALSRLGRGLDAALDQRQEVPARG